MRTALLLALLARTAVAEPPSGGVTGDVDSAAIYNFESALNTITDDPKTSADTLSDCQLVVLPKADGVRVALRKLTATDLIGAHKGAVTWVARTYRVVTSPDFKVEIVSADVDAQDAKHRSIAKLRVSAVASGAKLIVAHFAVPVDAAKAAAAPAPAQVPDGILQESSDASPRTMLDDVRDLSLKSFAEHITPATLVLAADPTQPYYDNTAIAGWPVTLALDGGIASGAIGDTKHAALWAMANVTATSHKNGKAVVVHYRVTWFYGLQVGPMGDRGWMNEVSQLSTPI